jgi:hypothetical protein
MGMVIYHLGFPVETYLVARIYPHAKHIACNPLKDTEDIILGKLGDDREFMFHIDLSVQDGIPSRRKRILKSLLLTGVEIHNAFVTDQRKRCLQNVSRELGLPSLTAPRRGDAGERLLVKSDLNVAGGPERRSARRFPGIPLPPLPTGIRSAFDYRLAQRAEIDAATWKDPSLHIERFIENPEGLVLRSFWNSGKAVVSKIKNPEHIIKKRNARHPRWNYAEPVDDLTEVVFARTRRYAEHLRLSLFAADWVVDAKNAPYLVDLNLTPQWVVDRAAQTANMTPDFHMADIPERLRESPAAPRVPGPRAKTVIDSDTPASPQIVIIAAGPGYQEAAAWAAPTYARHAEHRGKVTVLIPEQDTALRILKSHARRFGFAVRQFPFSRVSEAKLTSQLKCQALLFAVSELKSGELAFVVDADTCCFKPLTVPREVERAILAGGIGLVPDKKDRHFQSPAVPWYLHAHERLPYVNSGVILAGASALEMSKAFCEFSRDGNFLRGPFNDQKVINFALGRHFHNKLVVLDPIYNQIGLSNWSDSTIIQHFAGGAGNLARHRRKLRHQQACSNLLSSLRRMKGL